MKRKKQRNVLGNLQRGQHRNEKVGTKPFFASYESKDLKQTREKNCAFSDHLKNEGGENFAP